MSACGDSKPRRHRPALVRACRTPGSRPSGDLMEIQAAVAQANGAPLRLETIELDEPRADEVLVRIVATGLCHTDLNILGRAPLPWPAILGHEGAGVVEKVGAAVKSLAVGDHVVM